VTAPREFTLSEARAALRSVRGAVEALQGVQRELRGMREEINALNRRLLNDGVVAEPRMRALRRAQRRLGEEARRHVDAIHGAGAEIKGVDEGLIDFPTTIGGEPAYWCWRAGEQDIEWWHPRSTGIAGRRPVSESQA
jgi:hypothetical protein